MRHASGCSSGAPAEETASAALRALAAARTELWACEAAEHTVRRVVHSGAVQCVTSPSSSLYVKTLVGLFVTNNARQHSRKCARLLHPDHNQEPGAKEAFQDFTKYMASLEMFTDNWVLLNDRRLAPDIVNLKAHYDHWQATQAACRDAKLWVAIYLNNVRQLVPNFHDVPAQAR